MAENVAILCSRKSHRAACGGNIAAAVLGTHAQELLASPRPSAPAALQAQADRHGLLHEILQRLREDHVVWLYSIVAARLGSPPRVLADGPVVDPSGMKEVARGPSWQELHTLRRDLLLLTDSRG